MTTRADVDRLNRANNVVLRLVRRDLDQLFLSLPLNRPEAARDVLLQVVPSLVAKYGELAGVAASEWYEELQSKTSVRASRPVVAPMNNSVAVAGSVRFAAGHLFTDAPNKTLHVLSGALQRHVLYGSRETVRRNVSQDRSRPRWARVPSGAITCAFCLVMASRGFAYHSEESAGHMNSYHDDCDCMIVPEWDSSPAKIDGYDPDEWYEMYLTASADINSTSLHLVLDRMRAMYPESLTDGLTTSE